MIKIKDPENLTAEEREKIITLLHDDYLTYISESDDEELYAIYDSGCFTVGSMTYYNEKDVALREE